MFERSQLLNLLLMMVDETKEKLKHSEEEVCSDAQTYINDFNYNRFLTKMSIWKNEKIQ
jgi:hypothetical protein